MDETRLFISNSEIRDARRLFVKVLLFAPVVLLVVAVNIRLDPAGLYRKITDKHQMDEYHIAQALVSGRDVRILRPMNNRLLQKYFVESMAMPPDIVVLGSSHLMWLGRNIFPDKKIINNSVPDAELADYLGIFDGYAKKNLYPQRVICLLDPQLITSPVISEEWISIKEDTYGMLGRLGVHSQKIKQPMIPQAWLNVFSLSYFQKSMQELMYDHSQQSNPVNENVASGQFLLLKDGRCFPGLFAMGPESNRKLKYGANEQQLLYQTKPDKELEDILEKFIRYLMRHHIRVTLCLLPIHPQLYKNFLETQDKRGALDIIGVEHYYRHLAKRLGLEIIGSYDPAVCGLGAKDFYDGDHIRNDAIEKMFKEKGSQCSMPGL